MCPMVPKACFQRLNCKILDGGRFGNRNWSHPRMKTFQGKKQNIHVRNRKCLLQEKRSSRSNQSFFGLNAG